MTPYLEVIRITPTESFTVSAHGYPYHTVRWHFHPEYEIHLVTETSGHYFVGDHIGEFRPNNLIMTGPNLPHNWVSDVPVGVTIPRRCAFLQFNQNFIESCLRTFPELGDFKVLLEESRRGILFSPAYGAIVRPLMIELITATGARRVSLFLQVMEELMHETHRSQLASANYLPDPSVYMSAGMNRALCYLREHLAGQLDEKMLANVAGVTVGGFSRAFKRHTGMTFVRFVNRLRIYTACQLLKSEPVSVTEICYQVGFNNVSNFNRQFFAQKGMSPSKFRALSEHNKDAPMAA